jgi:hypothetical protein
VHQLVVAMAKEALPVILALRHVAMLLGVAGGTVLLLVLLAIVVVAVR